MLTKFNYKLDDAYEIHAGLEWAFTVKDVPLAVRTGYTAPQPAVIQAGSITTGSTYLIRGDYQKAESTSPPAKVFIKERKELKKETRELKKINR